MHTFYPTPGPVDTGPGPLYIRIPLEVSQDETLSDGAILLFGEILGLQQRYGACTAGDDHFQRRRHKSRPTIQRQITELSDCGHIRVITDRHTKRELRVAERYLSCKDGGPNFLENEKEPDIILENEKEITLDGLKNEKDSAPIILKNETYKTQENLKNQESEKENKTPESCRRESQIALSDEDQISATCRALDDTENFHHYRALWLRCQEQGRVDAWDIATSATCKCQGKGELASAPVAYFRSVLLAAMIADKQSRHPVAVTDAEKRSRPQNQAAPKEAPMPQSYSAFVPPAATPPTTTASQDAAASLDEILMTIPEDRRLDVKSRAEAAVKADYAALWGRGENTPACLRLTRNAVERILSETQPVI